MFIVSLTYTASLAEIDAHLFSHLEWLKKYYDQDVFILSGRKDPPSGGIIVATGIDRKGLEEILKEDPFVVANITDYEIIEFTPRMTAKALEFLKNNEQENIHHRL